MMMASIKKVLQPAEKKLKLVQTIEHDDSASHVLCQTLHNLSFRQFYESERDTNMLSLIIFARYLL